jgi:O-antigen ligase
MLAFGALAANVVPDLVRRSLWISLAVLVLWIPFDMQSPSGYYLLGLPFEKGAIQTGLVYGIAALIGLFLIMERPPKKLLLLLTYIFIIIMLVIGMLFSLSRTALLGFLPAVMLLCLMFPIRTALVMTTLATIILILSLLFNLEFLWFNINSMFVRLSDSSEHANYRFAKWLELWNFLTERPFLMIIGGGFNSPNGLVLGKELGQILAVDNSYIRRLFEVGVLGATVYLCLLITIFLNLFRNKSTRLGVLLLLFYLFSGLTAETFQISQSAGLFFLLIGIFFGFSQNKTSQIK